MLPDKLSTLEKTSEQTNSAKSTLQSQIIGKDDEIERISKERDSYFSLLDERNSQLDQISSSFDKACAQRDDATLKLRSVQDLTSRLEERLEQANSELDRYQQENVTLHLTRDEFDARIREMEQAIEKQNKKIKSKDKKVPYFHTHLSELIFY